MGRCVNTRRRTSTSNQQAEQLDAMLQQRCATGAGAIWNHSDSCRSQPQRIADLLPFCSNRRIGVTLQNANMVTLYDSGC